MDEPGSGPSAERDALDRLIAALGPRFDEARSFFEGATSRWRGDAVRVGEGTKERLQELARDLGLVTRDEWDELELRVAQLEHRLHLLEDAEDRVERP
jgi:polyhydroxyalkanoate synthesis regulator phasin